MKNYLRQMLCFFAGGHTMLVAFENGRMFERCVCGHQGSGWKIAPEVPVE